MSRLTHWLSVLGMAAMISLTGSAWSQATGVLGEYYKIDPLNTSRPLRSELFGCKAPTFTRVDPQINFNWGDSVPFDAETTLPRRFSFRAFRGSLDRNAEDRCR